MSDVITTDQPASATSLLQAKGIANLVERALLTEVRLTPKPGLVDIRNSGAHKDMDLALFEKSTLAVAPWMENFYQLGYDTSALEAELVLPMLRPLVWRARPICYRRQEELTLTVAQFSPLV